MVRRQLHSAMNVNRRSALRTALRSALGLGLAALASVGGLWTAAIARFMSPNVVNETGRTFGAGFLSDYQQDRVETKYRESHGVWIVRATYGGRPRIFALRTACTHLGCVTIWQASEQKFQCPCHGSQFMKDGMNIAGPAPRPLERCAIRLADDGQLEVDPSRTFQEQLGQWEDPESYVEA